jgi:hypothetical protein
MDADYIPVAAKLPFSPDEIVIYGVHLNGAQPTIQPLAPGTAAAPPQANLPTADIVVDGTWHLQMSAYDPLTAAPNLDYAIVAAYGYAFEGQCYRLDKVKILSFWSPAAEVAVGCGYENQAGFFMWRVNKLAKVIELVPRVDEFREIILEANLPGKRAPNTYDSHMRLAHRSGRLTQT